MSNTIPASQLVSVSPAVLSAGGNPLSMNAVFLDTDGSIPIGTVQAFANLTAVQNWFGANSNQATLAAAYFAGFTGSNQIPGVLYFAQYNTAAVAAYLRGGSVAALTLAQLQALSGTLIITINGTAYTTTSINLSGAASFSAAAALIQTALQAQLASTTCTYDSLRGAFLITSPTTGATSTIGFATGTLSAGLKLTSALGSVTSQGAAIAVPATLMTQIATLQSNWATFMTTAEPVTATKLLFAAWVNGQNGRFCYVAWDSDATATTGAAPNSFGGQIQTLAYIGVEVIWNPSGAVAAFFCGAAASIDFTERAGRVTFPFKGQPGLAYDVSDATAALNLLANGYNFFGIYATANQTFTEYQNGSISGVWKWADSYINQIYFNAQFQLALMLLLQQVKSVPYNRAGYNLIRAALLDPINQMANFGALQAGVTLTAAQIAEVNQSTGVDAATPLENVGWFLQVLDPGGQVRSQRGSPACTFMYCDGGSVHRINLASIEIQ